MVPSDLNAAPHTPPPRGCIMCDGLYIKANGEMPCWDDVGEELILRHLAPAKTEQSVERDLFYFPELTRLREEFLAGRLPQPEYCPRCAVLGHGQATSVRPAVVQVLHIEPSFLCHLACPQCIPPKLRRELKPPPYNMPLGMFLGILNALKADGVAAIRFIHFEGRGEPLMNPQVGGMVRAARQAFPGAYLMITTHGNFPYKPWMINSGLDVLRIAADGAFAESYARYRVGGRLEKVFTLMRAIRDARKETGSAVRVEWKYVLFEWNDSDGEIQEAARLAEEMEVRLRFCLTHAPGCSQRFPNPESLRLALQNLAPLAAQEITFQLKAAGRGEDVSLVIGEHAAALLALALERHRAGDEQAACAHLAAALARDPGIDAARCGETVSEIIHAVLPGILSGGIFPSTFCALAALCDGPDDIAAAAALLEAYLAAAPDAPDQKQVAGMLRGMKAELELVAATDLQATGDVSEAEARVWRALALTGVVPETKPLEIEDAASMLLTDILTAVRHPGIFARLANLRLLRGDHAGARQLFRRYLELAPQAPDRSRVVAILNRLTVATKLHEATELLVTGQVREADALVTEALQQDPGQPWFLPGPPVPFDWTTQSIAAVVEHARFTTTLSGLAKFALARGKVENARALLSRYLELAPDVADRTAVREKLLSMEAEAYLRSALQWAKQRALSRMEADVRDGLRIDPGIADDELEAAGPDAVATHFEIIHDFSRFPATLTGLANIRMILGDMDRAARLFRRYLELAPNAPDQQEVRVTLSRLRRAILLRPFKRLLRRNRK